MKSSISQVNKKIGRQVYFNYLIKSFIAPFFISLVYILCALITSKYFYDSMPTWFWLVLILPVVSYFGYTYFLCHKLFFTEDELSAYIDYKSSSEGMYLTAYELNSNIDENIQKQVLQKTSLTLPLQIPWRIVLEYIVIIAIFFFIIQILPSSFSKIKGNAGDLLAVEKAALDDMIAAKVLEPEVADQLKKELEQLKKDFKENGIDKDNWEKKQALGQMLEDKLQEQLKIQEKMQSQMEQLEKSINASEKLEELAKEMHSLEASLALNEFAKQSEEFQKLAKEMQGLLSEKKENSNGSKPLSMSDKLKTLEALKGLAKEMKNQQGERKQCSANKPGGSKPGDKEGEGNLEGKLSALAQRLDKEAKVCLMALKTGGKPGKGDVDDDDGPGSSEVEFTNQAQSNNAPLNLEKLNEGGKFNSEGHTIDISEGKHDKYSIDTQNNDQRNFQNTGTDLVNDQKVIPNRREVIKKYFKRETSQEK
jgi:hypothetical protein